jgi:para-nitrobenzyl esterase
MLRSLRNTLLPLVCGIALTLPAIAQKTTVAIDSGKLQGAVDNGILSFKGIPYAAPPVGDFRWRPPQPAARWSGVRSAAKYGSDCMQLPFPSDAAPLGTPPAEDCLYLNVWRPESPSARPLPVMVWIYGGGFVNGGSSPQVYDGSEFARQGIVFVSFNYRLGRFGFFAHPALTAESKDGLLGNYAYMDQIAALRWVQRNIKAFGGDPANVTLFGESAGGGSVHALINSPMTQGLFQKAIVESGGGRGGFMGTPRLHDSVNGKPSAEQAGVAFAKKVGITGDGADALKALRALRADAIVDKMNMASMFQAAGTYSGPMIDGKVITGEPQEAYLAGTQPKIPLIVGANSMEIGFGTAKTTDELFASFGEHAQTARAAYDPDGKGDLRALMAKVTSDRMMVEPARFVAATLSKQGQPVWQYRFSYVAESMRSQWPGAPHATEIPFVFDTVKAKYADKLTDNDEKAAQAIHAYWVQFAKTGNPNGAGMPDWPKYTTENDAVMDFTANGPVAGPDPWKTRLDVVAAEQK